MSGITSKYTDYSNANFSNTTNSKESKELKLTGRQEISMLIPLFQQAAFKDTSYPEFQLQSLSPNTQGAL